MSPAVSRRRAVFPLLFSRIAFFGMALATVLFLAPQAFAGQKGGGFAPAPRVHRPPTLSRPVAPPQRAAPIVRQRPGGVVRHGRAIRRDGAFGPGNRGFGHRRGHFRHGGPAVVVGPIVPQYLEPERETADPIVYAEPEPAYYRRPRCVAPKIIQAGPINKQPGSGPRLIYGSKNPCGHPTFENVYRESRAKRRHRGQKVVRKY
ncbi:MAG: hypothetical protein AB7F96_01245 [Beijerinckiaceae bacterium]